MLFNYIKKLRIAAVMAAILIVGSLGCRNDISVVNSLTMKEKSPEEVMENIHFFLSKEGVIEQEFLIDKLNKYAYPERYLECPDGFEIIAYRTDKTRRISLKGDYGVSYEDRRIMEAKRNVVITNFITGEIIETEHLVWDMNKKLIYSNVQIKQTQPDGSVYIGERFESNEDMSKYTVFRPHLVTYDKEE
ncbi:MAG: LPS export ABC transporter periplasmic protein LptC [Lentimicrobiaceae bacterium]|nr:LPS export ABC transporter periplasmic protein LptC [Lentimicrobiaceae bacterium]